METSKLNINFDNSYVRLPEQFYTRLPPTPVAQPQMLVLNRAFAEQLGLDAEALATPAGVAMLSGNSVPDGAEPVATAYAGHQFGNWVPQLGDGRAILLGEVLDKNGERFDIQLKGAGPTPYSRNGDGRAGIGPVLREYVVSEAMHALGIPTTRALAAVTTGDPVYRESVLPGAILTRVAQSHIRVGTFQFFAARQNTEALQALTSHVLERHYPDLQSHDDPALALLEAVLKKQAALVAQWQGIGFIHGVMNTDNCSVAGLTIDYGPCAFIDDYHPGKVFSSIDHAGRYAYQNQPGIAQWNCANLAQCLLPLIKGSDDEALQKAQDAVDAYPAEFEKHYMKHFRAKLGLTDTHGDDAMLVMDLLELMDKASADFTITFRHLANRQLERFRSVFSDTAGQTADDVERWLDRWTNRCEAESSSAAQRSELMRSTSPAIIPRNHQIETMINSATDGDLQLLERLNSALASPYYENPDFSDLMEAPQTDELVKATFCGT